MNIKLITILMLGVLIFAACQPVAKQSEEEKVCDVNDPDSCPEEQGVLDELSEESATEETKLEVKSSEYAKVVEVNEGELVSLKPRASDPDQDKIIFTFSRPLDSDGEWQTKAGDAGEYVISVVASDGKLQTTKKVKVVVNKVNMPPAIRALPKELKVKEGSEVKIVVSADDPNEDKLSYKVNNDKFDQNENVFTWKTNYGDKGKYLLEFEVSDGEEQIIGKTELVVERNNVAPFIEPLPDVSIQEGEEVTFTVKASDPNGDNLVYTISDGRFAQDNNVFSFKSAYTDAGDYRVQVIASDGELKSERFFRLRIEDVNLAPEILDIE